MSDRLIKSTFEVDQHYNHLNCAMQQDQPQEGPRGEGVGEDKENQTREREDNLRSDIKVNQNEDVEHHQSINSSAMSQTRKTLVRELEWMNKELSYLGFGIINHSGEGSTRHWNEVYQVVNSLLNSRNHQKDRSKELQNVINKMTMDINRMGRNIDNVTSQLNHSQLDKERLNDKIRELKDKEQRNTREKEEMAKQKRMLLSKEKMYQNQLRKKDIKISIIEAKLKKILEKNDKTEYRAVIETYGEISVGKGFPLHETYDSELQKELHYKQELLEKENKGIKMYLGQVYEQLLNIVECNPDVNINRSQELDCLKTLNMLWEDASHFKTKMKGLMDQIYEMVTKKDEFAMISNDKNAKYSNLTFAVEKMKNFYKSAADLEQKRSRLSQNLIGVMQRRQGLSYLNLQNFKNTMANPQFSRNCYEQDMAHLKMQEQQLDETDRKAKQTYSFIRDQLNTIGKKSMMCDSLNKNMSSLVRQSENESLL